MGSSGWQVVHCPGFHQYLLCTGGDLTPWVGSSFPPTTPCIGSGKRRLCTAHTQLGHWPVNDPEGGDGVRRHQARWRQDLALFIGETCYQKRQRTRLFRACELKWIAIQ